MSTKVEFLDAYKRIKEADELISIVLQKAIEHEEEGCPLEAIKAYGEAGQQINEVFKISVGLPDDPAPIEAEWLEACGIIRKMKAAYETVEERLTALREQNNLLIVDQEAAEAVDTEVVMANGNKEMIMQQNNDETAAKRHSDSLDNPAVETDMKEAIETYKKYANSIRELMAINGNKENEVQFDQIFEAQVQMYKIEADGHVETIKGEGTLTIIMITANDTSEWHFLNGASFMQCSLPETPSTSADAYKLSFVYPLLPAITIVYRTEYGAFIFPDLEATIVDMRTAYGIILSNDVIKMDEEAFADRQQFLLDLLESILAGKLPQLKEDLKITWKTQGDIGEKIVSGANFIAHYLVLGAEKTGEFMDRNTPHLMSHMRSAPRNARPVSTTVQRSVGVAKIITGAAAGATGWVAGKIGAAAVAVGSYLAPHVEKQGTNLLEHGFGYEGEEANSKMKCALNVAAGAVEGFTMIYGGLEKSADVLGKSLSNNSVKIISYKYGSSAGDVAADTFETLGNTWHVSRNLKIVRPKNFAESVLKKTSIGVVSEYKDKLNNKKNIVAARDLEPDLFALRKKHQ